MPSSLASTLGRKALCPPTLIPRKKTIKAMLPIVTAPKYRGEAEAVGPDDRTCSREVARDPLPLTLRPADSPLSTTPSGRNYSSALLISRLSCQLGLYIQR